MLSGTWSILLLFMKRDLKDNFQKRSSSLTFKSLMKHNMKEKNLEEEIVFNRWKDLDDSNTNLLFHYLLKIILQISFFHGFAVLFLSLKKLVLSSAFSISGAASFVSKKSSSPSIPSSVISWHGAYHWRFTFWIIFWWFSSFLQLSSTKFVLQSLFIHILSVNYLCHDWLTKNRKKENLK